MYMVSTGRDLKLTVGRMPAGLDIRGVMITSEKGDMIVVLWSEGAWAIKAAVGFK